MYMVEAKALSLGMMDAYLLHAWLHPAFIASLTRLAHARTQPSKTFGQRSHRILLEVVERRRLVKFIVFLPVIGLTAKATVLSSLIGREIIPPIGIGLAHARKVGLVLGLLWVTHCVRAEGGRS